MIVRLSVRFLSLMLRSDANFPLLCHMDASVSDQNTQISDQSLQMLRTVDQQLGVVHRQIADINQRIAKWEEGGLEVEADNLEEDMEEEDNLEDGGVKTLLDLGDGSLLTEDWTNSTVTEEVCLDVKVLSFDVRVVKDGSRGSSIDALILSMPGAGGRVCSESE